MHQWQGIDETYEQNWTENRELYDAKLAFHRYEVCDVVWCLMEVKKVGVSPKLEFNF